MKKKGKNNTVRPLDTVECMNVSFYSFVALETGEEGGKSITFQPEYGGNKSE
jgi:hypothetical protein